MIVYGKTHKIKQTRSITHIMLHFFKQEATFNFLR